MFKVAGLGLQIRAGWYNENMFFEHLKGKQIEAT